ncbi:MAG: two-component system sensor histidine kinase NtrB, partial [Parvularcula sp.]
SAHPFDKNKAGQRRVLVTAVDRTDSIRLRNERIRFAESIAETQKIEAINSFAGSLAHELSNLMQPISGYAKLLAGKVSDEQQKEYLARINQATLAAGRILRRTLSMSYGNSSSEARTDISTLVDETIQAARDLAPDGLIYETNLGQGLTAACPSGELRQVLLNVLNNAAEAMHYSGTVRVSLTFEQSPPDGNDLLPPGEPPFVHLTIEDEGPGLSPDVQGRLFDPFFTTKRVGRGTGLGLAVAQGLTTGWGGLITADNRTTGGARFDIWIPAIDG